MKFVCGFHDYKEAEDFVPHQVFHCDETGLFWEKMMSRTYITKEEKALEGEGSKPMKDRFTLLLCGNAGGDLKIKLLLFYHNEKS